MPTGRPVEITCTELSAIELRRAAGMRMRRDGCWRSRTCWRARAARKPRDCRYAWAYLLGAFRPERGVGAGLVMPYTDTQAMSAHLAEMSAAVAPGAQAILVLDSAGWHSSAALVVLDNITLLPLPPHGPDLNPVEDVWQYLRQAWLSLKVWEDPPAAISLPRIGDVLRYQGILRPVEQIGADIL